MAPTPADSGFISVQGAATALHVCPATVRTLIRRGKLPGIRIGNRLLRVPRSAVTRLIRDSGGHQG